MDDVDYRVHKHSDFLLKDLSHLGELFYRANAEYYINLPPREHKLLEVGAVGQSSRYNDRSSFAKTFLE